ncbi:hypothetical protein B0O99DRAFT_631472 [Bisporella sp. PMI_857]|nr:hypothetical protein B0O99DRAFT_631472 [Bisporella sp. PMI_857]
MIFQSQSLGESIIYLPEFGTLFRTKHNSAIPSRELKNHLRLNPDHKLRPAIWQPIFNAAQAVRPRPKATLVELAAPPHGSDPLPFLPILDGMRCRACPYLRGTRKEDGVLKAHVEKEHPRRQDQRWQDTVEKVRVQRWVNDTRGTYWVVGSIVRRETPPTQKTAYERVMEAAGYGKAGKEGRLKNGKGRKGGDGTSKKMTLRVEMRARRGSSITPSGRRGSRVGHSGSSPSLRSHPLPRPTGAGWRRTPGLTIRWDGRFEERLHAIMVALQQMLERCLHLGHNGDAGCALDQQHRRQCYANTFKRCQRQSSLDKYFRSWRQLVSYIFRVHHFDQRDRDAVYGRVYSEEVAERLTMAWELELTDDSARDVLAVQLFDISISLLTTPHPGGSHKDCTIMHFVGVLGIDEKTHFWKAPCDFTTILAGLVWMSRLLFLEYALPERPYAGLTAPDRPEASRTQYPSPLDRLHYIRTKYVRRGSPYPLDAMLDLLFKGNELRLREGGKVTAMWRTTEETDDTLVLETPKKSMTLVMRDFHQMRVDVVLAAEELVEQLMYGLNPDANLDQIHDNLANWNVGYSFMTDEHNNLQKAFHALRIAATSAESPRCLMDEKFQYRVGRCQEYLRDVDALVRRLFAAVHLTFGLPGRGTEINLVTWANSREHIRNICVRYGTILILTDNSKLKGSTEKPFWVVRAVPKSVARLLFLYIVYIRPFADSLQKALAPQDAERTAYLYVSYHSSRKHFSATDGSSALHSLTDASSMPMKIGLYRQASIAIAKKHVENTVKDVNPWEPSSMAEQISAWQCTHNVRTHRNMYARSSDIPSGLTEDLIVLYLYNSIKWHTFGDLERKIELARDQHAEEKYSRDKRVLTELDINLPGVKRRRIDDRQHGHPINTGGWEEKSAECKERDANI